MKNGDELIDVKLDRIVIQDGLPHQCIESGGERSFPIVIGDSEAREIERVVICHKTLRPLTHQLCYEMLQELGWDVESTDIVDLRDNTFYARLVLRDEAGGVKRLDARPSDAIALALRAQRPIRVASSVLERACTNDASSDEE